MSAIEDNGFKEDVPKIYTGCEGVLRDFMEKPMSTITRQYKNFECAQRAGNNYRYHIKKLGFPIKVATSKNRLYLTKEQ